MKKLMTMISLFLPILTFGQTQPWPSYSCENVTYQVSPLILKSLDIGQALDRQIEVTWVAADPKTNKSYPKNSPQKMNLKSTVDSFVNQNLLQSHELEIINHQSFPTLGAVTLTISTRKSELIEKIICGLPIYSIIIYYKGEAKFK